VRCSPSLRCAASAESTASTSNMAYSLAGRRRITPTKAVAGTRQHEQVTSFQRNDDNAVQFAGPVASPNSALLSSFLHVRLAGGAQSATSANADVAEA